MIRIVIYDDSDERRKSLEALFREEEDLLCVGSFPDCLQVEKQIESLQPDLILMDIKMPGIDGIDATRLIKKQFRGIKVIMQTVFDDDERIFNSLKAGAEGYILKSAQVEKIKQSIYDVYNGGAVMTPSIAIRVMQHFNSSPNNSPAQSEHNISTRELDVLRLLTEGLSYKQIAGKLDISYFTVNAHVRKIYEKLRVNSKGEAVSIALKKRIVQ